MNDARQMALEALRQVIQRDKDLEGEDSYYCLPAAVCNAVYGAYKALEAEIAQPAGVVQKADALGFALMEHLGPAALTGGTMSVHDAFVLGWNAAPQPAAPEPVNAEMLEIVQTLVDDGLSASLVRQARAAIAKVEGATP